MPITIITSNRSAVPVPSLGTPIDHPIQLITDGSHRGKPKKNSPEILQSSFTQESRNFDFSSLTGKVQKTKNGFVDTVILAYNRHYHLVIRPDDVWIAILSQFNIYVNKHAEELRQHFVAHEKKKELILVAGGTRFTVDFGKLALMLTECVRAELVDPSLQDWILPSFSTTTHNDTSICAIMMLSTLQAYFGYEMRLRCGIPSVTLEGEKSDWENILARLDKLDSFGPEPTAWAQLLRPILRRFINAFDGEQDSDFWGKICADYFLGSGPRFISGWITAFSVWDSDGNWNGSQPAPSTHFDDESPPDAARLNLDGVDYPTLMGQNIPSATCEVPVKLDDNGDIFQCSMVAGHVGNWVEGEKGDTVRPLAAWFMLILGEGEKS